MMEDKLLELPSIPRSHTAGLTSSQQLIDTTSNEVFSFRDSTAQMTIIPMFYPQEKQKQSVSQ